MVNHNQQVLDKLNDPNTPREEYMRLWHQWRDIMWQQSVLDELARRRWCDREGGCSCGFRNVVCSNYCGQPCTSA